MMYQDTWGTPARITYTTLPPDPEDEDDEVVDDEDDDLADLDPDIEPDEGAAG